MISINIDSWKKVDQKEKDQLWLTIKRRWNIEDDEQKDKVLTQCNHSWKNFKKALRRKMDEGEDACKEYTYLPQEDWKTFIELQQRDEVVEQRLIGREHAKRNLNPARLGPIGYRGHLATWEKEKNSELCSNIHMIEDERAKNYLLGRRIRDKDGQLRLPNELENLAEQLIQTDKEVSQGLVQVDPGTDPLTMVLGPEHPGRTRAVGYNIGLKQGMPHIIGKKRKPRQNQDVSEEIKRQVQLIREEMRTDIQREVREQIQSDFQRQLREQMEAFKEEMLRNQDDLRAESPGMRKSSVGSTQHMVDDSPDEIREPIGCFLLLPHSTRKIKCGRGMVYPKGNGMVHGVPLLNGHVKVQVDKVEQDYLDFKLPVKTQVLKTLQDSINSFIQWPRGAIVISTASKTMGTLTQQASIALPAKKKVDSAPTKGISNKKKDEKEDNLKRMKNKGAIIMKKEACISTAYKKIMSLPDPTKWFEAIIEAGIFGINGHEFTIAPVDIVDMMAGSWVDITLVIWFVRSLHMMHTKSNCAFFNPESIRSSQCLKYGDEVTRYLIETLQFHGHKNFFLAPYWQGEHWVLFILLPHTHKGFILDSIKNGKGPYSYHITKYLETAVRTFRNDPEDTPITWTFAECNQQTGGWECGYYVMRWIHEFIFTYQFQFPAKIPWNDTSPFDPKILDTIIHVWLGTFYPVFLSK